MKILTFTGHYLPGYKGGGPIKTIKNLFDQLGDDIQFKLLTSDRDLGDRQPYKTVRLGEWNKVGNADVFYVQSGRLGFKQIYSIIKTENYDTVYLNSFFSNRFSIFPLFVAVYLKKTILLGPRGEFSEGALSLKALKKKVYITLFKLIGLHKKVIFQASSEYEANDIRKVLGSNIDIKISEDIGAQEFATQIIKRETAQPLQAVFISRISPMKNLLGALQMLKAVKVKVNYDIYGPIEDEAYWAQCQVAIGELPDHITVKHRGQLTPDQVVSTLSQYDLFFMPTLGENYGHVIAEALCAGLPILIADTTPWRNLEAQGIGWDLPLDKPHAFSDAIDALAQMSSDQHNDMRKTVLAWAKNKFSQRDAVEANLKMFQYALSKKQGY